MQKAEAIWLASQLTRIPKADITPLLNVGSSTAHFRGVRQPWIEELVFEPIRRRGATVTHLDQKEADGVDLVGDVLDHEFFRTLASKGFRTIFCSNVLEHVSDRAVLCAQLQGLVPKGGYLVVTVPRSFPYHPDPIDTRFRPSAGELVASFPGLHVIAAEEVDCGPFFASLTGGWAELALRIGWVFLPFVRRRGWVGNVHRLLSVGGRYSATCVVMRRPPHGPTD